MTRDEAILTALRDGDHSTAELAVLTGRLDRTCRYGLRHLIAMDYVWSPQRGRYRLTRRGRMIAAEIVPDGEKEGEVERPRRLFGRDRLGFR
ncbi:MAG: hypothetical protein ACYDCI_11940 [Candidatus Limnocylindrales bacterium]